MRYILTIIIVGLAILSCGCGHSKTEVKDGKFKIAGTIYSYTVEEFEYDGCQYIVIRDGPHITITHKGNCKNCEKKNR